MDVFGLRTLHVALTFISFFIQSTSFYCTFSFLSKWLIIAVHTSVVILVVVASSDVISGTVAIGDMQVDVAGMQMELHVLQLV